MAPAAAASAAAGAVGDAGGSGGGGGGAATSAEAAPAADVGNAGSVAAGAVGDATTGCPAALVSLTLRNTSGVVGFAARIVSRSHSAAALDRRIRAMNPWPGCFFQAGEEVIRVLAAEPAAGEGLPGTVLDGAPTIACGKRAIRLLRLQRAGRAAMPAADFLRGFPMAPGTVLAPTRG